ncbi:class I SAM-dependent methyltransferase [Nocardioides speluncae]|uniref:class I SAM-dependent methyltransferase n=1 Tax=Nocardioides speluncae TaxID=2670337 RepID=UPI00197DF05C|nr:class I SAM-dependent methyltransferase [Nocardioides speluncae]
MKAERYASVQDAYDTVAESYAALIPDLRPEATLDLAMVDAFVAAVGSGGRVLDAGCGAGRLSRYLADRDLAVEGVDLSPGMVAMARRDHPDLRFRVGSISDLPYESGVFDGVLLWYSTIHTEREHQQRLYDEAGRVLRAGGHLLVGFQAGEGMHDTSATYAPYGHDVTLVRYRFQAEEVIEWLTSAGLPAIARFDRRPVGAERDDQVILLAAKGGAGATTGGA